MKPYKLKEIAKLLQQTIGEEHESEDGDFALLIASKDGEMTVMLQGRSDEIGQGVSFVLTTDIDMYKLLHKCVMVSGMTRVVMGKEIENIDNENNEDQE